MVDFGYHDEEDTSMLDESDTANATQTQSTSPQSLGAPTTQSTRPSTPEGSEKASPASIPVTALEVQPVVDALKRAFGLELFGFDILITSASPPPQSTSSQVGGLERRRMLVVDVNYFPSYKEVDNFPALLAKYLTDRALSRRPVPGRAPREWQLEDDKRR
jgi:Inositol 1,3,4-trisphosphate 5/6-kinase ATP-grasp domain